MYLFSNPDDVRPSQTLSGLSAPSEAELLQRSRAAIETSLQRNPVGGYVAESASARSLDEAFESVPICAAADLAKELMHGQGSLAKLFRYRLASATQRRMLEKLTAKANACLIQLKQERRKIAEELRKKQEQERLQQQTLKTICSHMKATERLVEQVCRTTGENSTTCKEQRNRLRLMQEENVRDGVRCN